MKGARNNFRNFTSNISHKAAFLLLLWLSVAALSWAQSDVAASAGMLSTDNIQKGEIDSIFLSSGTVLIDIPLVEYQQLGHLKLGWHIMAGSATFNFHYSSPGVLSAVQRLNSGSAGLSRQTPLGAVSRSGQGGAVYSVGLTSTGGYLHHPYGTISGKLDQNSRSTTPVTLESTDGSAVQWNGIDKGTTTSVADGLGNLYYTDVYEKDVFGNEITYNSTTKVFTDSLNRSIPSPVEMVVPLNISAAVSAGGNSGPAATASTVGCQGPRTSTSAFDWVIPANTSSGKTTYKLCFASITGATNFKLPNGCQTTGCVEASTSNTLYLQSIILPDSKSAWIFEYNDRDSGDSASINYGNVTKVTMPSGGTISYAYANIKDINGVNTGERRLISRTVNANDGAGSLVWKYTWKLPVTGDYTTGVNVTDPTNSDTYYLNPKGSNETITRYQGAKAAGVVLRTETVTRTTDCTLTNGVCRILKVTTTLPDGAVSKKEFDYDGGNGVVSLGKIIALREYGFGAGAAGALVKSTLITYPYQATTSYLTANVVQTQPCLTTVYSGAAPAQSSCTPQPPQSNQMAQTSNTFDAYGNITSTTHWLNNGVSPVYRTEYDSLGMPIHSFDAKGNETLIEYDSTGAFAKNIIYPTINGVAHTTNFTYESNNGQLTAQKDQNNVLVQYAYQDPLMRLTQVQTSVGASSESWSSYSYPSLTQTITSTDQTSRGDSLIRNIVLTDGLNRSIESVSNPNGTPAYSRTSYDALGRKSQVWNQSNCDPLKVQSCSGEATWGVTTYQYDALSRPVSVLNPDGSAKYWCYDGAAAPFYVNGRPAGTTGQPNCHANLAGATGAWVDYQDENGNDTQLTSDALGRLIYLAEPNGNSKDPSMLTSYTYDVLGNLLTVTQKGKSGVDTARTRSFTYDSLSRIITANNPESGTTCYGVWSGSNCVNGYDANNNLVAKTDARGVTTVFAYDALNRLTQKSYLNDPNKTPTSCIQYDRTSITGNDGASGYFVGRATNSWTQKAGTSCTAGANGLEPVAGSYLTLTSILAYDTNGHVISVQQCTPSKCSTSARYSQSYTYNLASELTNLINWSVIVPGGSSPLTLTYTYDSAARLSRVGSNWQDAFHPAVLFTANSFSPNGSLKSGVYGSNLTVVRGYDSRYRITSDVDTNSSGTVVYSYQIPSYVNGSTPSGYDAVGNIAGYSDSVNGVYGPLNGTAGFSYDTLNRLVGESGVSSGVSVNRCWQYDAFGNRTINYAGRCSDNPAQTDYYTASNRNQSGYVQYDNGASNGPGFVTLNTSNGATNQYLYDAEGRVCAIQNQNVSGVITITGYIYNSGGARVAKGTISGLSLYNASGSIGCDPNSWSDFSSIEEYILGVSGDTLTEMGPNSSGVMTPQRTYISAGSQVGVYDASGVHFRLTDWLGSLRVTTNHLGAVESKCTNLPFGDGQSCAGAADTHLYTGKERDTESGNDYFGARYYAANMGRWLMPDWTTGPSAIPYAILSNPQTLNLYTYASNNPIRNIDLDGHLNSWWPDGIDFFTGDFDYGQRSYHPQTTLDSHVSENLLRQEYEFDLDVQDNFGNYGGGIAQIAGSQDQSSSGLFATDPNAPQVSGSQMQILYFRPGADGVYIAAKGTCAGCVDWVQTITRIGTGDYFHREYVDKGNTTDNQASYGKNLNPLYTPGLSNFSDSPGAHSGGTWVAVLWVGIANESNRAFAAKGAITYGFSVGNNGLTFLLTPTRPNASQLRQSMRTINNDCKGKDGWTASYVP
jgi:RHS repeat-associated protein